MSKCYWLVYMMCHILKESSFKHLDSLSHRSGFKVSSSLAKHITVLLKKYGTNGIRVWPLNVPHWLYHASSVNSCLHRNYSSTEHANDFLQ